VGLRSDLTLQEMRDNIAVGRGKQKKTERKNRREKEGAWRGWGKGWCFSRRAWWEIREKVEKPQNHQKGTWKGVEVGGLPGSVVGSKQVGEDVQLCPAPGAKNREK